jgi:hypothetical protein
MAAGIFPERKPRDVHVIASSTDSRGYTEVTHDELAAALDALILAENKLELLPSDITVQRLVAKTNWNARRVKLVLGEWERLGIVECIGDRREPSRGQKVKAWRVKG